jgi:hypothetical protein
MNIKKSSIYDKENIFKDIDLKDIFGQDEVDSLLKDPNFNDVKKVDVNSTESSLDILKKSGSMNLLYDRTRLIIKFLKLSIMKLNSYNENTLAKGLEWYKLN